MASSLSLRCVCLLPWLVLPACGDDADAAAASEVGSSGSASSSGADSDSSGPSGPSGSATTPSTSTAAETIGEETGGGSDAGDSSGTTGEPEGEVRLRMLVMRDYDTPGMFELYQRDLVGETLTDPVKVSAPTSESLESFSVSPLQQVVSYRGSETGMTSVMRRRPDGTFSTAMPFAGTEGPMADWYSSIALSDDESRVYIGTGSEGRLAAQHLRASIDEDGLGTIEVLADSIALPGLSAWLPPWVSASGSVAAVRAVGDTGASNLWLVPDATPDPTAGIQISDNLQDFSGAVLAGLSTQEDWVYYTADRELDFADEFFAVERTDAGVGAPLRLHAPLTAGEEVTRVRLSPDGTRLAYFMGALTGGEIYLLDLEDPGPAVPTRLSTLGENEASVGEVEWSPDGRHLLYQAHHLGFGENYYVVNFDGAEPSTPMMALGEPSLPNAGLRATSFHPSGSALYVVAAEDTISSGHLYRVMLDGPTLGDPVQLDVPTADDPQGENIAWLVGAYSHSEEQLIYAVRNSETSNFVFFVTDALAAEPALPQRIGSDSSSPWFGTRFSPDDSLVIYPEDVDFAEAAPLKYVSVDALGVPHELLDSSENVAFLAL